jgi:hypothetical protein
VDRTGRRFRRCSPLVHRRHRPRRKVVGGHCQGPHRSPCRRSWPSSRPWRAVTALTLNASAIGPTGSWRSVEGDGRPHGGQGNGRAARRRAYGHASSRGRVGPASAASHEHSGGGAAAAAVERRDRGRPRAIDARAARVTINRGESTTPHSPPRSGRHSESPRMPRRRVGSRQRRTVQ